MALDSIKPVTLMFDSPTAAQNSSLDRHSIPSQEPSLNAWQDGGTPAKEHAADSTPTASLVDGVQTPDPPEALTGQSGIQLPPAIQASLWLHSQLLCHGHASLMPTAARHGMPCTPVFVIYRSSTVSRTMRVMKTFQMSFLTCLPPIMHKHCSCFAPAFMNHNQLIGTLNYPRCSQIPEEQVPPLQKESELADVALVWEECQKGRGARRRARTSVTSLYSSGERCCSIAHVS